MSPAPVGVSTTVPTSPIPLTPIRTALEQTEFHSWFPRFKRISPKATVVNLSELQPNFLAWFEEDGLRIPQGAEGVNGTEAIQELDLQSQNSADPALAGSGSDPGSDSDSDLPEYNFGPLNRHIRAVLEKYGGRVFPKLNWSAPQDAGWMLPGNDLQCMSPSDVYLLLKSSDFITNDIQQAQELAARATSQGEEAVCGTPAGPVLWLTLKKWFDMPPSHEFRIFVRADKLVAICQRDTVFYEHLQPPERQAQFINLISDFWRAHLRRSPIDPSVGAPIADYAADVYITRTMGSVYLVDINPYLPRTDALLFDWDELEALRFPHLFQDKTVGENANPSLDANSSIALRTQSGSADGLAPDTSVDDTEPRLILRLIRSFAEQQAAGGAAPKYAANMLPREVVDPSMATGEALVELARSIQAQESEPHVQVNGSGTNH